MTTIFIRRKKIIQSLLDAIGTLYIMGMKSEFLIAREWIENEFKFDYQNIVRPYFKTFEI